MRNPADSLRRVAQARPVGSRLRTLLLEHLDAHPEAAEFAESILRGQKPDREPPPGLRPED
eukprot:6265877-Lingulodinium_polyedra.AAC.1